MPTLQPPLPLAQSHRNQGLFSDYYLNSILPGRQEWRGLAETAGPVMEQIAALFAGYTPSANEAQVEHDLIRPVLLALGHTFEVQAPLQTPEGTRRPDYVFYRDAAARAANKDMTLTDERNLQVGGGGAGVQRKQRRRREAASATGQLSLLDDDAFRQSMSVAVGSMWLIEGSAGATVDDVKEQERIYAGLRETLTRKASR